MGNQLAGIAPFQIFPVEHYLTEHPELKFQSSLGSTRFLKVACAESQEGHVVVKVFAINDPTLPLLPYKERLEEIRNKLATAVNCLPFQKIVLTEKAGLIMREYVKYSLYDRISTRPFLTNIEKRWITFQVLYALHQCHKVGVCHGDIKLENITVTSWNWVLLVDFASFKPTFLAEDNPADYSYYFDTSRRRTCYIAPERFMKSLSSENTFFNETQCNYNDLKPSMDIYSAGCALLELWNEGHVPLEYTHILSYRSGEYSPQKHLDRLEDPALKALISSMIQKDPNQRLSAELYLSQERGRLFPEYFYSFLQSYMLIFSTSPILSPDEKINRLKKDISDNFLKLLCARPKQEESEEKQDEGKVEESDENDGLVIIISLVTSCIRGLHDCTSKLQSLEILLELAKHANDETILDRILPYILHFANDTNSRVKVSAINTVTKCLGFVKKVPRSDANIFPEYILPGLLNLATDENTCVRAAYAQNIATLAEISVRYLEQTQIDMYDKGGNSKQRDVPKVNYEIELQTMHEMVKRTVSSLLTDSQPLVKQTLLENGISKLCVFFGKQKANDVLLSHMITFLNDKENKELRGTFYDCIIGVAAYIGWHCSIILTPLLQQGITDTSEFVAEKSINAMSALTELGLLTKPSITELVADTACLLVHPNLWIRQAVVGFISVVARTLSILDVQCKVMPSLAPYMKYSLIHVDRPEFLLESLVTPIPRTVFDGVVTFNDIETLLQLLEFRKMQRDMAKSGSFLKSTYTHDIHPCLNSLMRRLEATGMNEDVEDRLLRMSHHLRKLHTYKSLVNARCEKQNDGKIEISTATSKVRGHVYNLANKVEYTSPEILSRQSESTNSATTTSHSTSSRPSSPPPESHTTFITSEPCSTLSIHERSYIQYRRATCNVELSTLINRQQDHYLQTVRSKEWAEQAAWQPQLPPPGWRLRGSLVAHLHEHRGPVTRLATIADSPFFASSSQDGYVRIWDCSKMEGKNIANRSKQNYKFPSGCGINGIAVCENGQSVAAACQDGTLSLLRIDPTSSKMSLQQTKQLDSDEDGLAVDIQYLDSGPQSVVIYATLYGAIVGWDLRSPNVAWRLENGLKDGVITTFCVDSHHSWLTLGTSSGFHITWDMRFQLPIAKNQHPTGARVRKIVCHPTQHSMMLSSVQGNNEISMWNLETGIRETVLWGSRTPPLSKTNVTNHCVCAMQAGCTDRSPFLLAAGTDQRVRLWNLNRPSDSYLAIHAPNDPFLGTIPIYNSRLVDGTLVYHEVDPRDSRVSIKDEEFLQPAPEPPSPAHRDFISDIALCKASQCFLLSASRDGVIKVWK